MTYIFAQVDRQFFFALKYMSEQRRLHIEKTFQGCSSPEAPSDPLHIQFLLSALTRRAIRALSKNWVRVPTAYPSPSQRSLSWSNLRLRCWWLKFWIHYELIFTTHHRQARIIGDGHSHVYVCCHCICIAWLIWHSYSMSVVVYAGDGFPQAMAHPQESVSQGHIYQLICIHHPLKSKK